MRSSDMRSSPLVELLKLPATDRAELALAPGTASRKVSARVNLRSATNSALTSTVVGPHTSPISRPGFPGPTCARSYWRRGCSGGWSFGLGRRRRERSAGMRGVVAVPVRRPLSTGGRPDRGAGHSWPTTSDSLENAFVRRPRSTWLRLSPQRLLRARCCAFSPGGVVRAFNAIMTRHSLRYVERQ